MFYYAVPLNCEMTACLISPEFKSQDDNSRFPHLNYYKSLEVHSR